jgi:NIPSNAP
MERRAFLTSSLAASALALTQRGSAEAQAPAGKAKEYYQIRRYQLQSGPQGKLTDAYVAEALIPALDRLGIGPVGAFRLDYGETPMLYVLMPSTNLETLVTADLKLAQDAEFMKVAEPFWSAPAIAPAFKRVESSLHVAFEGWPKLTAPDTKAKRIFQLRTYESPSYAAHVRKVEMFHHGEFDIFQKSGCGQVFYSDGLVGTGMPSLTYMLTFPDMAHLESGWHAFQTDPDWKKLSGSSRYSYEAIVSNVSNLILTPTTYSRI